MRFEGNSLMQGDTQVGRLIYKAQRWHWHATTPRPGRPARTDGSDRADTQK